MIQIAVRMQDSLLAGAGIEKLQETLEDDFFTKLVKINFKYIDQYYLQTQSQADRASPLQQLSLQSPWELSFQVSCLCS